MKNARENWQMRAAAASSTADHLKNFIRDKSSRVVANVLDALSWHPMPRSLKFSVLLRHWLVESNKLYRSGILLLMPGISLYLNESLI